MSTFVRARATAAGVQLDVSAVIDGALRTLAHLHRENPDQVSLALDEIAHAHGELDEAGEDALCILTELDRFPMLTPTEARTLAIRLTAESYAVTRTSPLQLQARRFR